MKVLSVIFLSILLIACHPDKKRKSDPEQSKFSTSDASELFFKNVRQPYYDKAVIKASKLDVYRNKDRSQAEDRPVLNLAIAVNWRFDEAYLLIEPNDYLQSLDTLRVAWRDSVEQQSGQYIFVPGNKASHFKFASQLYNSLIDQQKLYIIWEGQQLPVLNTYGDREAFRKTVADYYRLVDLF